MTSKAGKLLLFRFCSGIGVLLCTLGNVWYGSIGAARQSYGVNPPTYEDDARLLLKNSTSFKKNHRNKSTPPLIPAHVDSNHSSLDEFSYWKTEIHTNFSVSSAWKQGRKNLKNDITVVTQMDISRWSNLMDLVTQWQGFVVCAVYVQGHQQKEELQKLLSSTPPFLLENLTIHVYNHYYDDGMTSNMTSDDNSSTVPPTPPYPVNIMRNLALDHATLTDYVLLLDADFLPSTNARAELMTFLNYHGGEQLLKHNKTLLILPAFEYTGQKRKGLPLTRSELLNKIQKGVKPFHTNPYGVKTLIGGHGATNYLKWYNMSFHNASDDIWSYPTDAPWIKHVGRYMFEPYVLAYRHGPLPRYWDGFVGYGKNKLSWFLECEFLAYQFHVFVPSFVLHLNHNYETGDPNYRVRAFDPAMQVEFMERFIPYLQQKYGILNPYNRKRKEEHERRHKEKEEKRRMRELAKEKKKKKKKH